MPGYLGYFDGYEKFKAKDTYFINSVPIIRIIPNVTLNPSKSRLTRVNAYVIFNKINLKNIFKLQKNT